MGWEILLVSLAAVALGVGLVLLELRRRHMLRWLPSYVRQHARRGAPPVARDIHVLLCFADHYEPKADRATPEMAAARVRHWVQQFPRQFGRDDFVDHIVLDLSLRDFRRVLRRNDDRIDPHGPVTVVFDRYLALAVGTQPIDLALLPHAR